MNIFNNIDKSVNPCDDFYTYATGKWIENNPQPKEYPTWNVFTKLEDVNVNRINDIIMNNNDSSVLANKIHDYYNIIMNYDKRNSEGCIPGIELISKILYKLETNKDYIYSSAKNNIELFFNTGLTPDSKGSGKYEVCIYQSGMGLGNKDYYLIDNEDNDRIRQAYFTYIKDMHMRYYNAAVTAERALNNIWDTEYKLAKVAYSEEELQDPIKNYNRMTVEELSTITNFDWNSYLIALGYTDTKVVIVSNLEFLKVACDIINNTDIQVLHDIYRWNIMNIVSNKLSDDIYDIDFKFSQIFSGATVQVPKWKRSVNNINRIFSEVIGQIYVNKYFDESSKQDVIKLIENLKVSFKNIIDEQSWMSNETKEKAIDKLSSMKFKIGYPNKWEDYSDIPIDTTLSYVQNYMNIRSYLWNKDLKLHYNKDIDLDEWYMAPQSINAYYDQINNEICFPAGILQYPFYDVNRDSAENYGGIGVIIGHEMTHAFDNHGRLYDKHGVLNDWWTEEDANKFNSLTENTKNRFNNLEALPGLKCNGSLTLGENIADYGGIKIAYNACKKLRRGPVWENHFFIAYANNWAGVTTDETIKTMVMNNEHTINKLRVNGTLPMFTPWINYYKVDSTNMLYIDESNRAKIW